MNEQDNYFYMGFEFLEATMPLHELEKTSKARPVKFRDICRSIGRSLRRDEEAMNILKRNRKERSKDLILLGWLGGRWTKRRSSRGGETA